MQIHSERIDPLVYRDPAQLNIPISAKESTTRRSLWWWMMYMDQQFSITLGKPLAISTVGDCQPPDPLFPEPIWQSISTHIIQFTITARDILSVPHLENGNIDEGTDKLLLLQKSLHPIVQFDISWLNDERPLVGWPLDVQATILHAKIHNMVVSLNRRRSEPLLHGLNANPLTQQMTRDTDVDGIERGRPRVLESCRALLQSFQFFHTRLRAGMGYWTMGQMAFNASMLLTLSMLETGETQDLSPVQHAYSTFLEMNKLGIHKLANAAVERLGRLMKEFGTDDSANEKVMGCGGMLLLEDPGSHKLVTEGPVRGSGTSVGPDMAKVSSTPSQRSRLSQQRRRQARRATTFRDGGVSKSRRNSLSKGHRPLVDRRFSDSVTPRASHRRRNQRSRPDLTLFTTLSNQDLFSTTSTPTVKSEHLFTPPATAFDGLPQTAYTTTDQHPMSESQHIMSDLATTQAHGLPLDSQQQAQQAFLTQTPHQEPQTPGTQNQLQHENHTMQTQMHAVNTDQQNFDFSNNSTPFSAEFFDGSLSAVVGNATFDEQHLNFEHPPFSSAPPFSMGEAQAFVAGQF